MRACVLVCRLKTGHIFCAFGMFFIFIIIMIVINLIFVCSFYFQHFSCILFAFLQIQRLLFWFGCVCIDVFVVRRTCNIVLKLIWFDSNKKVKHITHAHTHTITNIHSTKTKRKCWENWDGAIKMPNNNNGYNKFKSNVIWFLLSCNNIMNRMNRFMWAFLNVSCDISLCIHTCAVCCMCMYVYGWYEWMS